MPLPASFYTGRSTEAVARELLGTILVMDDAAGRRSGMIVETEAYLAGNDPASHSYRGQTKRNLPMFGPPGTSYIYLSYGMHHCFNVVCQPEGVPEAVLIRALQPLSGIELMRQRRGDMPDRQLTNGPGKLCQALGIDLALNGHPLEHPPLTLLPKLQHDYEVAESGRIGISVGVDLPLRFFLRGNPFVSRKS